MENENWLSFVHLDENNQSNVVVVNCDTNNIIG